MNSQIQCSLLHDLPELSLSMIWQQVCKLPMADRRALLAACKKALSTFGGLVDRMARLELTMKCHAVPAKLQCSADPGGSSGVMVARRTSRAQATRRQRGSISAASLLRAA